MLASSKYLGGLRSLGLEQNDIVASGVRALANSPRLAGLQELALAQNAVEEALGSRKVGHSHHSYTTSPRWVPRFPAASIPAKGLGLD